MEKWQRRGVNSTLAGEAGSCCDCLGELEWLQALWGSFARADFDIRECQRRSKPLPTVYQVEEVLNKDNSLSQDPQAIAHLC